MCSIALNCATFALWAQFGNFRRIFEIERNLSAIERNWAQFALDCAKITEFCTQIALNCAQKYVYIIRFKNSKRAQHERCMGAIWAQHEHNIKISRMSANKRNKAQLSTIWAQLRWSCAQLRSIFSTLWQSKNCAHIALIPRSNCAQLWSIALSCANRKLAQFCPQLCSFCAHLH